MADNFNSVARNFAPENIPEKIRKIAFKQIYMDLCEIVKPSIPDFKLEDVYVVWFNFTLGNWKALVSTTLPDGRYYELTHRVDSGMVFMDTYQKVENKVLTLKGQEIQQDQLQND